jgi:hypothetical protein
MPHRLKLSPVANVSQRHLQCLTHAKQRQKVANGSIDGGESGVCSLRICFSQQILDTLSAQPQLPTTCPRPVATAAAAVVVVVVSEAMYILSTAVVAAVAAKAHVWDTAVVVVVAVVVGI